MTLSELFKMLFPIWKNEDYQSEELDESLIKEYERLSPLIIKVVNKMSPIIDSPYFDCQIQAMNMLLIARDEMIPQLCSRLDENFKVNTFSLLELQLSVSNQEKFEFLFFIFFIIF